MVVQKYKGRIDLIVTGPPKNFRSYEDSLVEFCNTFLSRNGTIVFLFNSWRGTSFWIERFQGSKDFNACDTPLTMQYNFSTYTNPKITQGERIGEADCTVFGCVAFRRGVTQHDRIEDGCFVIDDQVDTDESHRSASALNTCPRVYNSFNNCASLQENEALVDLKTGKRLVEDQFSKDLILDIVERYSSKGKLVCDPFAGSYSTAMAAIQLERCFLGCEANPRIHKEGLMTLKSFETSLKAEKTTLSCDRMIPSIIEKPSHLSGKSARLLLEADCLHWRVSLDESSVRGREGEEEEQEEEEEEEEEGLFARKHFNKGDLIGYYWGFIVGSKTCNPLFPNFKWNPGLRRRKVQLNSYTLRSSDEKLNKAFEDMGAPVAVGDTSCAVTWAKRGALSSNACLKDWYERDKQEFVQEFGHLNVDVFKDPRTLALVATRDIAEGEEILTS